MEEKEAPSSPSGLLLGSCTSGPGSVPPELCEF